MLASWRSMMKIECGSESISQRHESADPDLDPHQNVMDPQHWYQHCFTFHPLPHVEPRSRPTYICWLSAEMMTLEARLWRPMLRRPCPHLASHIYYHIWVWWHNHLSLTTEPPFSGGGRGGGRHSVPFWGGRRGCQDSVSFFGGRGILGCEI